MQEFVLLLFLRVCKLTELLPLRCTQVGRSLVLGSDRQVVIFAQVFPHQRAAVFPAAGAPPRRSDLLGQPDAPRGQAAVLCFLVLAGRAPPAVDRAAAAAQRHGGVFRCRQNSPGDHFAQGIGDAALPPSSAHATLCGSSRERTPAAEPPARLAAAATAARLCTNHPSTGPTPLFATKLVFCCCTLADNFEYLINVRTDSPNILLL